MIFNIGVFAFGGVVLFHLVTLPVELNASSRALKEIEAEGIVYEEEISGAKKVLSAAALTYVAALAVAVFLAYRNKPLIIVSLAASAAVLVTEFLLHILSYFVINATFFKTSNYFSIILQFLLKYKQLVGNFEVFA